MKTEHDLFEALGVQSRIGNSGIQGDFDKADASDNSSPFDISGTFDEADAPDESGISNIPGALDIDVEKIKKIVNDNLNSDPLERKVYMKKKIFSIVLAATLIMSITCATAFAATSVWNDKLVKYFKPTQQQMEKMQNAVDTPVASATNNGYTVDVLQTIVDKHSIYVLYDVTAPAGVTLSDDLQWKYSFLDYATKSADDRYNIGVGDSKILEVNGNKMTVLMWEGTGGIVINDQDISLHLEKLTNYTDNGDEIAENIVGNCSLDLGWKLNYEDLTKTIKVGKSVNVADGSDVILSSVEISPLSVWLFFEVPTDMLRMNKNPVIKFKDGTSFEFSEDNASSMIYFYSANKEREGGTISWVYQSAKIMELSDIENITVGDIVIPVN